MTEEQMNKAADRLKEKAQIREALQLLTEKGVAEIFSYEGYSRLRELVRAYCPKETMAACESLLDDIRNAIEGTLTAAMVEREQRFKEL